jgi:hypothetical protein
MKDRRETMTNNVEGLTRHDLEAKIVKRSWEDDGFRKEFTSDPTGTAVKYLKVTAAGLPKIVVHEEASGTWHIVLPQRPPDAGELTEADLERVAGGVTDPIRMTTALHIAGGQVGISTGSVQPPTVEVPLGVETPPIWYPPQQGW